MSVGVFICADKTTVSNSAIQYRRPEFYSSVNQCILVDDSTFEIVLSKSVQAFVKARIFLVCQN